MRWQVFFLPHFPFTEALYMQCLFYRKLEEAAKEESVQVHEKGYWGLFMDNVETINRKVRPKCRQAVKSQVIA